jgi:adhesin transport system outer membrane protein
MNTTTLILMMFLLTASKFVRAEVLNNKSIIFHSDIKNEKTEAPYNTDFYLPSGYELKLDKRKDDDTYFSSDLSINSIGNEEATLRKDKIVKGADKYEGNIKKILNKLVYTAITNSYKISSSTAQTEAALAGIDEAKGQRWPQIDISSTPSSAQFGKGEKRKQYDSPIFTATITTNVYDFGRTDSTVKNKTELHNSALQALRFEKENIAWEVISTEINLIKQEEIIKLSKKYVARMQELTNMLQEIVKVDAGRRSELTQAKSKLIQAESLLYNAESSVRDLNITLERYLGKTKFFFPPVNQWRVSFGTIDEKLKKIEFHPAILKGLADSNASLMESEAIKASGMPQINWTISKSTAKDDYGRQDAWHTGLNLNWALFKGGSTKSSELAAKLRAESGKHIVFDNINEYTKLVLSADQDAHSFSAKSEIFRNMAIESEKIRRDFFEQWYHLGRRTLLDVLSAETDYYNQQVSEISNKMDSYSAIFKGYFEAGYLVPWLES